MMYRPGPVLIPSLYKGEEIGVPVEGVTYELLIDNERLLTEDKLWTITGF